MRLDGPLCRAEKNTTERRAFREEPEGGVWGAEAEGQWRIVGRSKAMTPGCC